MDRLWGEGIRDRGPVDQSAIPFHCRSVKWSAVEASALLDRFSATERPRIGKARQAAAPSAFSWDRSWAVHTSTVSRLPGAANLQLAYIVLTPMLPKDRLFKIGKFTFSRTQGLRRAGRLVSLRHQERQLLKCLLERPGEVVRKEEIHAMLWPEIIVSDNTLNVHVSRLRAALGDTKRRHRLLKSVSGAGFMVMATPTPKRVAPEQSHRVSGDKSRFVRDVTIPDGSVFEPGEAFEKIWEIQNLGSMEWKSRSIRRVGVARGPGRLTSEPSTPIPDTKPGELCLVRVFLTAPSQPGSYYAQWKMVNDRGELCLSRQEPLFVSIDVVIEFD
jgi:DNA-binding winged helix-turn-helix (wHTH) protein